MARDWLKQNNTKKSIDAAQKILGKSFGWLTVLEVLPAGKVRCRCACGNVREKPYNRSDVQQGKTTSCGCMRSKKINETNRKPGGLWDRTWEGQRYGSLVIQQDLADYRCLVQCDCGNFKEVFKGNLTNGDIKSCGCQSYDMRSKTNLEKYGSETISCNISKQEKELSNILKSWGLDTTRKDILSKNGSRMELDIVIEDKKFAIEFHGARWHSTQFKKPMYHYEKMSAANHAGYRLVQIFDFEWKSKKKQILSFLRSALGMNKRKVAGRKVNIRLVDPKEAKKFLSDYHILGPAPGEYLGCYLNDELLAVAVFRKHHVTNTGLTMARWCVKEGVTVQGGLSKLMKAAKNLLNTKDCVILTWADLRFSEANGYKSSGWDSDQTLKPDYFYYNPKTKKVIYKYQRRKSVVKTPEGETEAEHANRDGLYKIWDCGKVRFKFNF